MKRSSNASRLAFLFAIVLLVFNHAFGTSGVNAWYQSSSALPTDCKKLGKCLEEGYIQCTTTIFIDDIPPDTELFKRSGATCVTILQGTFEE